ncbi:MAG: bifunctional aspartate kinase/homoserine dehydrogenase I [Bacteroidales bacterium]|nr:bifunctional aspartate kinase/homoserine dehydrogenase I [Bacteroidales bacterium]
MKVLKFGGSSVGTAKSITNVKRIVEETAQPVIVVVSALGGVTDKLIAVSHQAAATDAGYTTLVDELQARHHQMIADVVPASKQADTTAAIDALFDELQSILHGVFLIQDLTPKTADAIVAYGERLSSIIAAALINGARHYDSRTFIKTVRLGAKHLVDFDATNRLVRETFAERCPVAVMGGFISSDLQSGVTTNLGRGGSDYTAAIIAAALQADVLEIWTDVDGFLTADPRIIPQAYTIPELSYGEATELCNFGAKVVYPPTIFPVCAENIPIYVKNTLNPKAQGSVIRRNVDASTRPVRGISSINETSMVTVSGMSMVGVLGVNRRIFTTLADGGVSAFMVVQTSSETSTSICTTPADGRLACRLLDEEFKKEIAEGAMNPAQLLDGLATVAVVGERMKHTPGIAGKIFSVLGHNGISIHAMGLGALEMNLSFVVDRSLLRKSLNVLHSSFFLSDYQELNLFVCGTGTVGNSLLQQIAAQRESLMRERGLKINLVGVCGRTKAAYCRDGIDIANYREALDNGVQGGVERMVDEIAEMNIFNSVFVDCTASAEAAAQYRKLLSRNVSVVAANKIAASSSYDDYLELKHTARERGVKYLFETNVGAGLPIINTIGDLTGSGDHILRIEAVLSGTLNYVFNTLSEDVSLSQAVRQAKECGYSEPDPRIDLSGQDVVRKLTILARESGYRLETTDVERHLFIPQDLFDGSLENFWERLPELDAKFEEERKRLLAEQKRWRFVAEWSESGASVSLREIPLGHPFYDLEGSNNIILLTTERYREYPMLIQGYGAGADVTAAGVFADIMRVANI